MDKETGSKIIYGQTFIHELTHVWHAYHSRRLSWITDALVSQTFNSLIGSAYQYQPGKSFGEYNLEQQASIIEHWFQDAKKSTSPLYGYIEGNIRLGNLD